MTVGQLTIVDPLSVLLIALMSALGAVLLCAALILIIGCCVCRRRVKKKMLKYKMAHESEKEVLHQQVENVVSQIQVLHGQIEGGTLKYIKYEIYIAYTYIIN